MGVCVGVGVIVGVCVWVGVCVGVAVCVGVGVIVGVPLGVGVGVGVHGAGAFVVKWALHIDSRARFLALTWCAYSVPFIWPRTFALEPLKVMVNLRLLLNGRVRHPGVRGCPSHCCTSYSAAPATSFQSRSMLPLPGAPLNIAGAIRGAPAIVCWGSDQGE